ncbi:MAG: hypothetical protein JWN67_4119 [Actinomycetia bacterium]|nr:hypothetical protein [Actinomycetes bacterium]
MTRLWLVGLVRRRSGRLLGAAAGVALAVGLVGSLGVFVATAKKQMTHRAIAQVAVDWQVEVQPGGDPSTVLQGIRRQPETVAALLTGFGTTSGMEATTGGTTQSTGPGIVLGLAPGYRATFPAGLRTLVGSGSGVLLAQQTAANLRAGPGDVVIVGREGLPPVRLRVDGIVELPQADSLFQKVGAPPGSQPQAPPDNVLLVPIDRWHRLFDPLAASRPDLVRIQVHARLDHRLPDDPAGAFTRTSRMANRLEADLTGAALVGNNLGATLDAARSDALYAEILFVLLGLPGAALAGLLTRTVADTGRTRRRRQLALLRARGATTAVLQRLAVAEAALVAAAGCVAGLGLAALAGRVAFGTASFGASQRATLTWALAAAGFGVVVAVASVALPARRDAAATVAATRREITRTRTPIVLRYGADILLLASAAVVFWASSRNHYQLVLAPEGVPTVSVNYWALAGPLLLWTGAGLAVWRLTDLLLGRGSRVVRAVLRPVTGNLARPAASSLARRRRTLATAVTLLALTFTFAISTAVFNATYRQQARVDAVLTNGADVTVTPTTNAATSLEPKVAGIAGVRHVEPLEHRFAYVGADLQDLYGVQPDTIRSAGKLQDAYFTGGTAKALLGRLARRPDAALFSAETVLDFQLHLGDAVHLRLRDRSTGQLTEVAFRYVGVAKEFPTAPKDSFIVANAAYLDRQAGPIAPVLLLQTHGSSPRAVAAQVRAAVGTGATVTDIDSSHMAIGSSLTAVDLAGLTRLELGYALVLSVASCSLVLALGLAERRRAFAIISAVGAGRRQLGAFVRSEAVVLGVLGAVLGAAVGWTSAVLLVKVLTGVFDPPPEHLAVPWLYLLAVFGLALGSLVGVAATTARTAGRQSAQALRDL